MKTRKSDRGFGISEFVDLKGTECSIQDSSLASEAAIWLGVQSVNPHKMEGEVLVTVKPPIDPIPISGFPWLNHDILYNTRMHLTIEHVETLIKEFNVFLSTKSVEKRCFIDRYETKCSIQLTDGCIELGCDDANPRICDRGWRPVVFPEGTIFTTHMFLCEEQIGELLPVMKRFVEEECIR